MNTSDTMVRNRSSKKKRADAKQQRLPAPKPVVRIVATQDKRFKKSASLGSGALVRHIDRETISVTHSFVWRKVDKVKYYGNDRVEVFDSPVIASMAGNYTRFRYRALRMRWQPAVSTQTAGMIAFTCSTIQGMESTPDLVSLGSMPGTHLGVLYEKGESLCDARVYKDEWFNINKGRGAYTGTPRVIFTTIGVDGVIEVAGFLTATVTIEFSSPSYLPMSPVLNRVDDLTTRLKQLQVELAEAVEEEKSDDEDN